MQREQKKVAVGCLETEFDKKSSTGVLIAMIRNPLIKIKPEGSIINTF